MTINTDSVLEIEGMRGGALAFWDVCQRKWITSNPGTLYYSTVSMQATHFFDGVKWVEIWSTGNAKK